MVHDLMHLILQQHIRIFPFLIIPIYRFHAKVTFFSHYHPTPKPQLYIYHHFNIKTIYLFRGFYSAHATTAIHLTIIVHSNIKVRIARWFVGSFCIMDIEVTPYLLSEFKEVRPARQQVVCFLIFPSS